MASLIVMPQLSPTMEEGVLLKWTKKEGDKIMPGDVIAEVETDKANMDFPLEDEGTLLKLLVKEGETVKLGAPVAVLGEPGEDYASVIPQGAPAAKAEAASAAPVETGPVSVEKQTPAELPEAVADKAEGGATPAKAAAAPTETQAPTETKAPASAKAPTESKAPASAKAPAPAKAPASAAIPSAVAASPGTTVRASPLARKLARENDLDLQTMAGTGPHGRVIKRDIDEAVAKGPAPAPVPVEKRAPAAVAFVPGEDVTTPLSPMRRTIARRLTEAKATVPHFYVTMDARVDALWDFHQQLKGESDVKISFNDLVLKAVAVALRRVPEANASFTDAGIVRHGRIDLGIAVSIDDGLVTPVLRNADQKSLSTIARESRDLIERARARKLRSDEFTGSTFSVSNMGMYGVKEFAAVINPPDGGILAVGTVEKRAIVVTDAAGLDKFEAHRMMTMTVSADHRVVDGSLAARLLGEIVKILERPLMMVL